MILLFAAIVVVKGQSMNTQSAYNALKEFDRAKNPEEKQKYLLSAKKFIDEAAANSETATDGKTWFYKAVTYVNLYRATKNTDATLFETAIQSFKKAYEFDTKKKFTELIMGNVDTIRQKLIEVAGDEYAQNKFSESMISFEKAASVMDIINKVDTSVLLRGASKAAERAGRFDKARDYYLAVMKAGGNSADLYYGLGTAYISLKDKPNAVDIITKGRKLYPKNMPLINAETNCYLAFGEDAKAMEQLKVITSLDSTNFSVFHALGSLHNKIYNDTTKSKQIREQALTSAIAEYQKALKLNPKFFDAAFNLGTIYYNLAAELLLQANNLPADAQKEYQALKDKAVANLDLALPYFEQAEILNPNDLSTLIALKQIYVRKSQLDKVKLINERINALQKK